MSVGKPARAKRSSWMFAGTLRNSASGFISCRSAGDSRRAARASQYHHPADIGQSRKYASETLWSCFILANLAYSKKRSEDRVNDPRLPVRSGP
jgi:hypothetical protein